MIENARGTARERFETGMCSSCYTAAPFSMQVFLYGKVLVLHVYVTDKWLMDRYGLIWFMFKELQVIPPYQSAKFVKIISHKISHNTVVEVIDL